jgi:hypothetical protein
MKTKLKETRPANIRHLKQQILHYIQAIPNDLLESVMTFSVSFKSWWQQLILH